MRRDSRRSASAQRQAAQQGDTRRSATCAPTCCARPQLREQLQRGAPLVGDVQAAKLARAVMSERQLQEVMTDFWENHFSVYRGKGQTRIFIPAYDRDVIRPRALGRFRDLLGAVAKSPAMLFYLDQFQSAVGFDCTRRFAACARRHARARRCAAAG